jgi:hypothetical protein
MQGILIDPNDRTVTLVELPKDGVSFASLLRCEYFDCVTLRRPEPGDPGAALYVDDEGMKRPDQKFWSFSPRPDQIFAGIGLVTAIDYEGNTVQGVAMPQQIAPHVVWRDVQFDGFHETTEDDVEIMPGVRGFKITRDVRFKPSEEE